MPHKHKRKAGDDDAQFNLPPTVRATPLPASKTKSQNEQSKRTKKRKISHIEGYGQDDTPKAFQRLMAFSTGAKKRSGLDEGLVKSKKQKRQEQLQQRQQQQKPLPKDIQDDNPTATQPPATSSLPKILPGETMSAFSQRVDAALPLTGIAKSGKKLPGLTDHRVTKHEKKLKRLQKGWREEEARIRDREAEAAELAEEELDEHAAMWEDKTSDLAHPSTSTNGKKGKKQKGKKRKKVVGEIDNHSDDEWEALKRSREQRKGLHDVVSAPPEFKKLPREIFKVRNGAGAMVGNVPAKAGSLAKREELGMERRTIIDTYRELMAGKRATAEDKTRSQSDALQAK